MNRKKIPHDGLKMPGWIKYLVYATSILCLGSGIIWLALHYFAQQEGLFGPEPNPLEHAALVMHGCISMLLVWCVGLIFVIHIKRGWQKKINRTTGIMTSALMCMLLLSGLGIYYLGSEQVRDVTTIIHWISGLAAGAILPLHIYWGRYLMALRNKHTP